MKSSVLLGAALLYPWTAMAQVAQRVSTPDDMPTDLILKNSDRDTFIYVEHMPEFPGDVRAFIRSNTRYPKVAADSGISGRAVIKFLIYKDGTPTDFKIIRSTGNSDLDAEALRVVRSMPKWKPAQHDGQPVKCFYNLPVVFRLD